MRKVTLGSLRKGRGGMCGKAVDDDNLGIHIRILRARHELYDARRLWIFTFMDSALLSMDWYEIHKPSTSPVVPRHRSHGLRAQESNPSSTDSEFIHGSRKAPVDVARYRCPLVCSCFRI